MGRRYIYFCDNCGDDFKNEVHLNVKSASLALSYPSKMNLNDPTRSEWKQRPFHLPCGEYHFCDDRCLGEFIQKKMKEIMEKIKPEGGQNA